MKKSLQDEKPTATQRGETPRLRVISTATQNIVNKVWNFAHVLRDDGLSYMAYTEQITFLLFLKMPDDTLCDPACGTGGFLICSHQYVAEHHGKA